MPDRTKAAAERGLGDADRVPAEDVLRRPVDRRTVLKLAGRGTAGLCFVGSIGAFAVACSDDGKGDGKDAATTTAGQRDDELWTLSLEEVARLVADKQVSPVDLTQQLLDRIERLNPQLNAFITITTELAMKQARAAEQAIAAGEHGSPLLGIPIGHKDILNTKGIRTTAGSKILAENIPDDDATVVARLADAGAVTVGKLNLWEFAAAIAGTNPYTGAIHNPWDPERIPGGTSAGSAAAVSAGLVYAATGTDTGGSIRGPASWCGVVGLKPTYGRVSWNGIIPGAPSLDHAGPLARTVRDAAILLQAIAGPDPLDSNSGDARVPDYLAGIDRGAKGLRVGIPTGEFWNRVDPAVESAFRTAVDELERDGAEVRDVQFPQAQAYYDAWRIVAAIETGRSHARTYPSRRSEYGKDVAALLEAVQLPEASLQEALAGPMAVLTRARGGEADAILDDVDVLAMPTRRGSPYTIAEAEELLERSDLDELEAKASSDNLALFDLTGQPAISVPCGFTPERLPVGMMIVGRQWDEPAVLRAARAYEELRGPFPMPPI